MAKELVEMTVEEELSRRAGVDLFGVAEATSYEEKAPQGHRPSDFLPETKSIIVLGLRMLDVPLDGLPATRLEYTANFHLANQRLNEALFDLASFLQSEGYRTLPVPYKEMPGWNLEKRSPIGFKLIRPALRIPKVKEKVEGLLWDTLSYRHLAVEAGLGELGLNNLLLTPAYGPRVRLVALLTDAPLTAGKPFQPYLCQPDLCGYACVKACPAGAFSRQGDVMDRSACFRYYIKLGIPGASGLRCGLCVARCPVHRKSFREKASAERG